MLAGRVAVSVWQAEQAERAEAVVVCFCYFHASCCFSDCQEAEAYAKVGKVRSDFVTAFLLTCAEPRIR